jgi:hypothetical protein
MRAVQYSRDPSLVSLFQPILVIVFLLFFLFSSNGQIGLSFEIFGVVVDSSNAKPIEYASVAIYKMADNLMITGSVTDLFNTRKWIVSYENSFINLYNERKYETRVFWLELTYNLNSIKSKKQPKPEVPETDSGLIKLGH